MSSISSVSSTTSTPAANTQSTTVLSGKQTLGQNDFLQLLSTQFQNQDPMKPMEDTAFIAQMAQFSALEQSQTLTQQMTQLRANQDLATATSYIGRQLTVDLGDGTTATGMVSGVDASGSTPQVIINDHAYPLSSVLRVELGSPASTAPTATAA